MSTTLYQKYRPKKFSELVNQNHIKITLQNEIAQNKVGHCYLLYGPRAIGKTTTARLLAKAVNCENRKEGDSEPCNECESCKDINNDRSLDIIEIDAASHTGVDNVRENIIAGARVATAKRKYKVFIIDEVHMLSISAFNALLKTLEEPPRNVIFVLATTEIHKVPTTIISRCQKFHFKKISDGEMLERLKFLARSEGKRVDDSVLESVVRHAQGYVRDAESLLGQVLSLDEKMITKEQAEIIIPSSNFNLVAEFVEYIVDKNSARAIEHVNNLVEDGVDLEVFGKDLIEFLRKLLFSKISNSLDNFSISLNKGLENRVMKMKEDVELGYLVRALKLFVARVKELKMSDIVQLPLEMAIIELGGDVQRVSLPDRVSREDLNAGVVEDRARSAPEKSGLKKIFNFTSLAIEKVVLKGDDRGKVFDGAEKGVDITFDDVKGKWSVVVDHIRKNEPALSFMMGAAVPQGLDGNVLKLGFRQKFHCEAMKVNGKLEKLESILFDILGAKLRVVCFSDLTIDVNSVKVTPKVEENSEECGGELEGVLDMFAGKVVE
jgi:DNA polymerase-3 subunit gamma/tau